MHTISHLLVRACLAVAFVFAVVSGVFAAEIPSLEEAVKSKADVWAEAAMSQPDGASYEFFEKLLPPPRYVNADFHFYPIVLSAPKAKSKARLISNGSGINLKGGGRQWRDNGTPAVFRVGPDELGFGRFHERLQGEPTLADGYLPIVSVRYLHQSPIGAEGMVPIEQKRVKRLPEIYELEAFASVDPVLADDAVVFVKFSLPQGMTGRVTLELDGGAELKAEGGRITDEKGRVLAYYDKSWKKSVDNAGKWRYPRIGAAIEPKTVATLAIPTKPLNADVKFSFDDATYEKQRALCANAWKKMLAEGMNVETPERVVNNAWRHLLIQNFELLNGRSMRYSAGNQYDALYEAEGSDAALAMMVWGYESDMREMMGPLFDFLRKGLEFHQAGFKLNNICRYYWQTRDESIFEEMRPRWQREAERLDKNRTAEHGLYAKEQYCGDIHTPVQSVNVASKAWRAMRDLSAALDAIGEKEPVQHYASEAAKFRQTVQTAIEKSANHSTSPPFVPIALYDNEPVHSPICEVRIGSYWNITIGYTIGSGIFPPGSDKESWIPRYQEQHGGLFMGMIRSGGMANTSWNTEFKINPLYGTRYALDTLRRDDPERALASFYGMLAQGFTRNTFVCGEGAALVPLDKNGRLLSLPPNSAANAHFLSMLRYALVQDWDNDDDGVPETLRLGFATPKRWLADGKGYEVERAPTAFGPVSIRTTSNLAKGEIVADVELPSRNRPKSTLLRARVPDGWKVVNANAGGDKLSVDEKGTVDLSSLRGKQVIRFRVEKN
jgi:hypothetical protein